MERTVKRVLPLILTLFFTVLAFFGSLFLGNMPGSSAETEVQLYVGLGAAGFGGTSVMTNEKLPDADGITSASKSLKVGMGKKGLDQWAWMDGTNGADASAVSDAVVEVLLRVNLTNEALVQMGVMDASNGADPNQPNVLMTLPVNDSPSGWYYLRFPVGALAKNKLVLCMIDHKQTGFNDSIYIFSAKVYSDPALTAGTMTKCSFGDVQLEAGPTAMEISPAEGSEFKVGSVVKMETYFTPVLIENSGVTFTSSDPSVAYVHNNFVYCAGEGSAVISAVSHYNENVKASYNITVSGVSTANRLEFAEFATSYPEESDFTPFGTGTSYYVESPDGSAVNVDFRFSEPVAISEAGVSSVNELIFEMWVYSAGAPTFGFRACGNAEANFNNQDGFLQVDSSSYTTQLYQFKEFKPYAWNKIAVAARGSFSGTLQNIGTFQLMDAKSDIYVYGLTMRKAVPGEVSVNYGANFVGYENADCRGIFIGEPIEIDATSIIPVGTGIKKTDGVYTLEKSSTSADFQVFAEVDKLATCKGYSYNSNNPDIATVTEDGVVSVIKAGKATLTVTSEDGKAVNTLVINIKEPDVKVTGINILQGDVEMSLGSSVKLSAAVYPSDADDKSVTWAAVSGVTVTADGMVTLTSPEGGVVRAYSSDAEIYDEIKIIPLEPENVKLSMSGGMWGLSGEMVSDSVPGVAGAKPSDESLKWKNGDTQGKFSEGTDISAVVKSGYGV